MLRSDRAGFSMLEALVALSILSLVLGVVVSGTRGPSPGLRLRADTAELVREAAGWRRQAIAEGRAVHASVTGCNGIEMSLTFYSDGTAKPANLCLEREGVRLDLAIDPLNGRLKEHSREGR